MCVVNSPQLAVFLWNLHYSVLQRTQDRGDFKLGYGQGDRNFSSKIHHEIEKDRENAWKNKLKKMHSDIKIEPHNNSMMKLIMACTFIHLWTLNYDALSMSQCMERKWENKIHETLFPILLISLLWGNASKANNQEIKRCMGQEWKMWCRVCQQTCTYIVCLDIYLYLQASSDEMLVSHWHCLHL